jgi:hypothetical protein
MSRAVWEKILHRFDPEKPLRESWRADRDLSPADEIVSALDRPVEDVHVLLTGTMGTGKTTELLRVAGQRAARGAEVVVFLDLDRHFDVTVGDNEALQHIASWEVCWLVGVALLRAVEDRLGFQFPEDQRRDLRDAWQALAKATDTPATDASMDLGALAKSVNLVVSAAAPPLAPAAAAGLKVLEGVAGAVTWSMGRSKKPVSDEDASAKNLLACVNRMLATFRQRACPVLFIIDGLDRITKLERAERLFLESDMVGRLDCPLVVCGPFVLRHHIGTASIRSFSEKLTLVNVPVLVASDPRRRNQVGIEFLCELYRKRLADLPAGVYVDPADLEDLAYFSGGRVRDFVTMIGTLAGFVWDADAPRASKDMVRRVLDKERRLLEQGLDRGHLQVLKSIVDDPAHRLPEGVPDDKRVRDLLTYGRLLPYSNGSEWFYPHPLLMSWISA